MKRSITTCSVNTNLHLPKEIKIFHIVLQKKGLGRSSSFLQNDKQILNRKKFEFSFLLIFVFLSFFFYDRFYLKGHFTFQLYFYTLFFFFLFSLSKLSCISWIEKSFRTLTINKTSSNITHCSTQSCPLNVIHTKAFFQFRHLSYYKKI